MSVRRDSEPESRGISRRRLIGNAGAATAAFAVTAAGADALLNKAGKAAAADSVSLSEIDPEGLVKAGGLDGDLLTGEIVSIGPRRLVLHPPDALPITVVVGSNAYVSRAREVPLSMYRLGDEVIVLGKHEGDRFTAVGVSALYRRWVATVYSREGNTLDTSEGQVLLTPLTVGGGRVLQGRRYEARSPDALKAGDEIIVEGMVNHRSGTMSANFVSVPADGQLLEP